MRRMVSVLTAALLALGISGCSLDSSQTDKPADSANATDPVPTKCKNPLGRKQSLISARELAFCEAEALGKLAGYVQTDTINGTVVSVSRVNIDPLMVEITSEPNSDNPGSQVILANGAAYLKQPDGSWVQARPDSKEADVAYQATLPKRFEALMNPNLRAAGTSPNLVYTLGEAAKIGGDTVFVLEAEIDDGSESGRKMLSRIYVRPDYLVLRSETESTISGRSTVRVSELTGIDEPQRIINPRFER
ncbi:MAG: hypothetical protein Q4E03_01910 [Trueperella sp.]|nr:hypothetical protein [Trueperella sp.]